MRGGEKVVEAMCRLWPKADIFTHIYCPESVTEIIRSHRVITTFVQRLPFSRRLYKKYLPLMPYALENLDLTAYDLVISSESGPAKGVVVRPDALHICYCHSPMRYLWDQAAIYRLSSGRITKLMMSFFLPGLRSWDYTTAARVDQFIANSEFVKRRIEKYYRRDAIVLHPPVATEYFTPTFKQGGYYLAFGQLVRYKRFDIAVKSFTQSGRKLIIAGTGEEEGALKRLAGPTIEFRRRQSNEQIRDLLRGCRALVFPGEEDFGIVPVEAMACGRPVIAYASGGALESIIDGVTGVLFAEQSPNSLLSAIDRFETTSSSFDGSIIRVHAERFNEATFLEKLTNIVASCMNDRQKIKTDGAIEGVAPRAMRP
jgi:glycosyltransferase involved in cell wall biosynthesis